MSEHNLQFPNYDFDTEEGKTLRARLLRCWLELGLWLEHAHKVNPGRLSGRAGVLSLWFAADELSLTNRRGPQAEHAHRAAKRSREEAGSHGRRSP